MFTKVNAPMLEFTGWWINSWVDYDNDGDLDLMTNEGLFKNNATQRATTKNNHWLKVKLVGNGTSVNTAAIGCEARIDLGGGVVITRQVDGGGGAPNGNQPELTLHFGLGAAAGPVNVQVKWTNGSTQTETNVTVDQMITITQ